MLNRCSAHSSRSKEQCKKAAMLGTNVCRTHGGAAPQVRRAAERRLLNIADITRDRTILEIARLAYGDMASFFNDNGSLKLPHELNVDQRATLSGFEAVIQNTQAGDGKQDLIHKFKTWDKTKALEMLAKHFAITKESIEHSGEVAIRWETKDESEELPPVIPGAVLLK